MSDTTLGTITVDVEDLAEWGQRNLDRQGASMLWARLTQIHNEQQTPTPTRDVEKELEEARRKADETYSRAMIDKSELRIELANLAERRASRLTIEKVGQPPRMDMLDRKGTDA